MPDEELIKKFVDLQNQTQDLLKQEKVSDARQKYSEVLSAYHQIEKSPLEHFHKEIAYDQVTSLFRQVNDTKERIKVPINLIVAGGLIIAFSLIILFSPSIVGLVSLEDLARQPVDIHFTESGLQQVTLRDRPLTLSASGEFTGKAKLYLKQGNKLQVIFDSDQSTNGSFKDICMDTCSVNVDSNAVELFASLDSGSFLTVKELSYKVQRKDNGAPVWKGNVKSFKAQVGKPTTVDLADYFTDPETDKLVYLSTTDEGLSIIVQDSTVTITPQAAGTRNIIFIASDLLDVTRVPVSIDVQ